MTGKVYSEVDFIIKHLSDDLKTKIPERLLKLIDKKKIKYYTPDIDMSKALHEQNLEHDTLIFLTMIYYNCWCDGAEEKQELLTILKENEKKDEIVENGMSADEVDSIKEFLRLQKLDREDNSDELIEEVFGAVENEDFFLED